MSDATRTLLRQALTGRYKQLRQRLARRLGSESLAGEVLHETWLRLGQGGELGPIANPDNYVYRAALNTATNMRSSDQSRAVVDLSEVQDLSDEAPRQDRVVESRIDLEKVMQALDELPPRQREAFLECFTGGVRPEDFAARHDVSIRTVQADIRDAVIHCARRLGRKDVFANRRIRVSRN